MTEYLAYILGLAAIFSVLAGSLDLIAGRTGMLSLCHAGLFGIGAYTATLLGIHAGFPMPTTIVAGAASAGVAAGIIALALHGLRDDYFTIGSFAFQMILASVFVNWNSVTGGPVGLSNTADLSVLGWSVDTRVEQATLAVILAVLAHFALARLAKSPFGRVLAALREDDDLARSFGKNPLYFRISSFTLAGVLAGGAGGVFAYHVAYITPRSFSVAESILVITMVILGGAGSIAGPIIGATVLVLLPEALRFLGLSSGVAANVRQIIYGALLLTMMAVRPMGLLGTYGFAREDRGGRF